MTSSNCSIAWLAGTGEDISAKPRFRWGRGSPGHFATVSSQIERALRKSLLRATVIAIQVAAMARPAGRNPLLRPRWRPIASATVTAPRARYIRRSAMVWVITGTTLEDGARIPKNHAPRNPAAGLRHSATAVAAARAATSRPQAVMTHGFLSTYVP